MYKKRPSQPIQEPIPIDIEKKIKEFIAVIKVLNDKIEKLEAEIIDRENLITYYQNSYEKKLEEKNKKIQAIEKNNEQYQKEYEQRLKVITEEMERKVDEVIKLNTKDLTIFQAEIEELKTDNEKYKEKNHELEEKNEDLFDKNQKSQSRYEQKLIEESKKYNNNTFDKPSTDVFNQYQQELIKNIQFSQDQLDQITYLQLSFAEKFIECDRLIAISAKSKNIIKQKTDSIENLTELIEGYKDTINKLEQEMERIDYDMKELAVENKRMKHASKKILQQRTDTEIFFIEALDDVKKELYHRKKESEKRGNFFPTLKKFYDDDDNEHVDIRNLEPEVKEKIIRKLFEKMNQGYEPSYYKEIHDVISVDIN